MKSRFGLLVMGSLCIVLSCGHAAHAQQVNYEALKTRANQVEADYKAQIQSVCEVARHAVANEVVFDFARIKTATDQLVRLMPPSLRDFLDRSSANLDAYYSGHGTVKIDEPLRASAKRELTAFSLHPETKALVATIEAQGYRVRYHTEGDLPPSVFVEERTEDGRSDYANRLFVSYFGGGHYNSDSFEVWSRRGSSKLAKVCNDGTRFTSGETVWEFTIPTSVDQKRFYDFDKRTVAPVRTEPRGLAGGAPVP